MTTLQILASIKGHVSIDNGIAILPNGQRLNLQDAALMGHERMPALGWTQAEWTRPDSRGREYGTWHCRWTDNDILVHFRSVIGTRLFTMSFESADEFAAWSRFQF